MGEDPIRDKVKKLEVRYMLGGKPCTDVVKEHGCYTLPKGAKLVGAWYGLIDPTWQPPADPLVVDVTAKVAAAVKNGEIDIVVDNNLAGRDPLFRTVKQMRVAYVYDGVETTAVIGENTSFKLPANKVKSLSPPVWSWQGTEAVAWQPLKMEFVWKDSSRAEKVCNPPAPVQVSGPWRIAFPVGWSAPAEATFPELIAWNDHSDDGIRYFSGTATYAKSISASVVRSVLSSDRVMLDLGVVKDFAEVKVNGRKYPVLWKEPFRLDVTDAVKGVGTIDLEIKVTNLWANRLIGDDRLYKDDCAWNGVSRRGSKEFGVREIPVWVKEGRRSPTGRHTFTTWKHWSKEDSLLPSGLIGPVLLRGGEVSLK
jgi:hypothetical protein